MEKTDRYIYILFLELLGALPLVVIPGLSDGIALPKAFLLQVASLALFGLIIAGSLIGRGRAVKRGALDLPVAVFLAAVMVAAAFATHVQTGLFGQDGRYEGLFTFLAYAVVYFTAVQIDWNAARLRRLATVVVGCAAVVSAYGLAQFFGVELLPIVNRLYEAQRSSSTLGNPVFLAGFLVMALPPAVYLLTDGEGSGRERAFVLAATVLIGFALVTTFSRVGWVGAVVALGFLAWFGKGRAKQVNWRAVAVALLAVGLVVGSIGYYTRGGPGAVNLFDRVVSSTGPAQFGERLDTWNTAVSAISKRPLTGFGPGNFKFAYNRYQSRAGAVFMAGRNTMDVPHNIFLEYGSTMGLLALVAFVVVLVGFFVSTFRFRRGGSPESAIIPALLASVTGYLLTVQLQPTVVPTTALMWSFIGVISGLAGRRLAPYTKTRRRELPRESMYALFAVMVVIGISAGLLLAEPLVADRYAYVAEASADADPATAETYYREAIAWHDAAPYRRRLLDISLARFKATGSPTDLDVFETDAAMATDNHPDEAGFYALEAEGYLFAAERGQSAYYYGKAAPLLVRALELYPNLSEARFLLGVAYLGQKKYALAEVQLRRSVATPPILPNAWFALGRALEKQGKPRGALAAYEEALRLEPGRPQASRAVADMRKRLR